MKEYRINATAHSVLNVGLHGGNGPIPAMKLTSRGLLEAYVAETLGLTSAAIERMNRKLRNGEVYSETAMLTDSVFGQIKTDA